MDIYPPPYKGLMKDSKEACQPNTIPDPEAGVPLAAAPIRLSYWADFIKNQSQRSSMNAAYFIFMSAGMSIACSIGFDFIQLVNPHIRICWFVGAIIGGLIGLALVERITKCLIYFLAIGLVFVHGICLMCAWGNYLLLTLGRYCDGIAFGMTFPAFIMAASEESDKRFRGMTLGLEHVCITFGMLIQVFFAKTAYSTITPYISQGIVVLIFAFASLFTNILCTIESPVYHLRKDDEAEARNVLHSLRKCLVDSQEVTDVLAEHKQLLKEDVSRGIKLNLMSGLRICPRILMLLLLTTISVYVPMFNGLLRTSLFDIQHFMFSRLVGALIGSYVLDILGRRAVTSISLLAGGIVLIVFGLLFVFGPDKRKEAEIAIMLFEFFAGVGATSSTIYLGEAFSVSVKPYFVVVSMCFWCLMQILLLSTFIIDVMEVFAYIMGAIQSLFAIYFFITTNETKETSLRDALVELCKPAMVQPPQDGSSSS